MMAVGLGCVFKRQLFPICVCVCWNSACHLVTRPTPLFGVAGSGQLPLVFSPSLTNWQYLTALARSLFWPPVYTAPWRTVIKFPCVVFRLIFHQRVVLGQKKRNHFQSWYLAFWTLCVCAVDEAVHRTGIVLRGWNGFGRECSGVNFYPHHVLTSFVWATRRTASLARAWLCGYPSRRTLCLFHQGLFFLLVFLFFYYYNIYPPLRPHSVCFKKLLPSKRKTFKWIEIISASPVLLCRRRKLFGRSMIGSHHCS